MLNNVPPPPQKSCRLWDNVENHGGVREAADDNIIRRMRIACWIGKATRTQVHTSPNSHPHTHTREHAHTPTQRNM
jgi:hypothetical protein